MTVDKRYLTLTGAVARQMEVGLPNGRFFLPVRLLRSACQLSCH